ncbi:DNA ligase 1 isoform X11 [Solanum tuberosum]|uniref:DNA ligase 1 isoform X11 n=1 Tax=Solanum tuberosum TaxID=4113 RepID=UPI00073A4FA7|nr:PREDICTED: DNA ligase 1 isoform X11 [Solanum tuberosum]
MSSAAGTLTLDSITLYITALNSLSDKSSSNSIPLSLPLSPIPSSIPQPKLIPRTRFIIDGFKYAADFSVSYFLSHFHSDHYTGLSSNWSKGIIFCSSTTANLLIQVLNVPAQYVVSLPLSEAVLIDGSEVYLIDANHCPGAVQFLFKVPVSDGKFERYVHTGDFRYCDDMKLEPVLNAFVGADAVFLDTTYCHPKFIFPSQQESIDYIVGVIEKSGAENEGSLKNILFLIATYVIGKEKILIEVSRRCQRKIHVDGRKMSVLGVLGHGEDGVFTTVESETDVHVVGWNVLGETWPYFRPNFEKMDKIMNEKGYSKVVGFVPTGWTYEVKRNKFSVRKKDSFEIHLVPYSEHSNYDELREYVKFLKPKHVIPTVGTDVEKLDSKHANAMRKHFAGLVDEMAIKQEFLMGFHRSVQGKEDVDAKASGLALVSITEQENTNRSAHTLVSIIKQKNEDTSSDSISCNAADMNTVIHSSFPQGESVSPGLEKISEGDMEEILEELQGCLPTWVTKACWSKGQAAPYIHLARTFELVKEEKGKIKATSMLCNMFRSLLALSPEDVLPAVYLCTNKIAPDHENMELNIGGSTVVAALEEACGTKKSKVRELYNSLGDLGDVAQLCRQTQSLLAPPVALTVRGVYSALRRISLQAGSGSAIRKKSLIVNLMCSCREKEMKFLVRTLVRNLRIGAMMRTVLPALAQAVVFNSTPYEGLVENLKDCLQRLSAEVVEAYNILPSLDVLVPSLMEKGIEFSSNTLSMAPGIPIKPMLAKITNGVPQVMKLFHNKAFTCEYKYDGQRAQIHKLSDGSVRVFSRNGDETTSRFPDLVNIITESCDSRGATFILDAEVVAIDRQNGPKLMSFQELSSRERGSKDSIIALDKIKVEICIFVFDIMFANGEQLLNLPLRQRRKYLKDLFGDGKVGYLEYATEMTVECDDACADDEATLARMNSFLNAALHASCEGIMVKSLDEDAGYTPSKRSDAWLKVKRDYVEGLNDSLDLVPIGAWHGNGRKAGWYSPFLMACYNPDTEEFQSVCRVMSGFSDSFYVEMRDFFDADKICQKKPPYYRSEEVPDMWFSPEVVWVIRGADFTVSPVHHAAIGLVHPSRGISVRFPRFIRCVSDRKPEECSTSADIADMFRSQIRKMDVKAEK